MSGRTDGQARGAAVARVPLLAAMFPVVAAAEHAQLPAGDCGARPGADDHASRRGRADLRVQGDGRQAGLDVPRTDRGADAGRPHRRSPLCRSRPGSIPTAAPSPARSAGSAPGATADDVAWLKLDVVDRRGSGTLAAATSVQRINTPGGALSGACERTRRVARRSLFGRLRVFAQSRLTVLAHSHGRRRSAGARYWQPSPARAYLRLMPDQAPKRFGTLARRSWRSLRYLPRRFGMPPAPLWSAGPPMPTIGYVAMAGGIIISLAVGFGLMGLLFYSSRHGYDETYRADDGGIIPR